MNNKKGATSYSSGIPTHEGDNNEFCSTISYVTQQYYSKIEKQSRVRLLGKKKKIAKGRQETGLICLRGMSKTEGKLDT